MSIIGHIGARKGSKGVKGKNFKLLHNKPLISYSIDQLVSCSSIDSFVVSTDDPLILDFAIQRGAIDIGLRPDELSGDTVSKWDVWQHSLKIIKEQFDEVDIFIDLDCTSPLRDQEDIKNAIELYYEKRPDMVMSCCEARKNPYFNLVEKNNDGSLYLSKKLNNPIVSRQMAPLVLEHAASIYVIKPDYLMNAKGLLDGFVIPYMMKPEKCFDIDSELDFKIVEFLMRINHE